MRIQEKARARCQWLPILDKTQDTLYLALADQLAADIACGTLKPGDPLPPQRLLADALGVTLGTISRAYREAERRGLTEARVGSGTRIRGIQSDEPKFHHLSKADADSIDLSLSIPIPNAVRSEQLAISLQNLANNPVALRQVLAYQPEQGNLQQREILAKWLTQHELTVSADELILTEGGQHADFLAMQALIRPGEAVASAALTYPGMIAVARQLGLKHLPIPTDEQGIMPDALERLCQQQKIRLLYVMPEYNNPTGEQMSESRRLALIEIARRYDLLILEDAVQYVLPEERGTPFYQLAPERSLYIFSVSKIIEGGIRFGALRAPTNLMPRLSASLRAQCWSVPGIVGALVCQWLESGNVDALIDWQWQEVKQRQVLLQQYLSEYQPIAHPYGFHAWLNLPEPWRAVDFVNEAARLGITLIASDPFCVGSYPAPQAVRICVTPPADIIILKKGLQILKDLLLEGPSHTAPLI
ncbi:PLP-dependent aminotransferase family protein [Nitrincola schmidtii]|uniref:aminotransferase-like domain-containing protein n=1 Tax=Nitrincola schmidtii TaxID=1730894 RepID=UPI00124DB45D|nr:PLP-dependent aminotransferase family protein [Nitrincola schmidtii]